MGIKELTKFIEPCGVLVSYDEYSHQYVAVDAFQKIYKYCVARCDTRGCKETYIHGGVKISDTSNDSDTYNSIQSDEKTIFNKHLRAIINCVNQLIKFKIMPIFVFDGSSITSKVKNKKPTETSDTQNTNTDIKQENTHTKTEQIKKNFKISPQQIKECEILISHIGIPYVRAPFEADSQCAAMTMKTCSADIKTVITDDTDALVFGSSSILRMLPMSLVDSVRILFSSFIKSSPDPSCEYSILDILEKNKMNGNDFICNLLNKMNFNIKYSN
jgi:5'-3' exonuclease